jgi:protocatechuate 3,4-dioxygenase beta subunit
MVTSAEVTTDDAGRFQLRGLATGAYRVTFGEPADRVYTRLDGVQVNDLYGANLLNLRLQSGGETGTLGTDEYQPNKLPHVIRGSVVDARGEPVPGIRVRAQRQ